MKNFAFLIIVLMACFHCSEGSPPSGLEKVGQTDGRVAADQTSNNIHTTTMPKGSGSQEAYLDPETGELIPPSEHKGAEADRAESKSPSADTESAEEIVEEKSPVPGGGVMIDLKGRFHSPSAGNVEKTGKPEPGQETSDKSE